MPLEIKPLLFSFLFFFSSLGAIAVNADSFREGNSARILTQVNCSGEEDELLHCSHSNFTGFICSTAGAICQG